MPDSPYKTFPNTFQSRGVVARATDDTLPQGTYLNLENLEELTENAMSSRLGSVIVNKLGPAPRPLNGPVHTLSRLLGLNGKSWRYAGAGTTLYRRAGALPGEYTPFFTGMSGNQWSSGVYRPNLSSYPYLFIADSAAMLKDNGTLAAPQLWGIHAPWNPVQATLEGPLVGRIDGFDDPPSDYSLVNFTGESTQTRAATTLTTAVTATGNQTVSVADGTDIAVNQLLVIDAGLPTVEVVLVTEVNTDTFTAGFNGTHLAGATVTSQYLTGTVAVSTTATVSRALGYNLSLFPDGTPTSSNDFIAFALNVSNPVNIEQIRLYLDVGDGSFTQDYFYAVIAPDATQSSVSETVDATQALAQAVFGNTLAATVLEDATTTDVSPLSPYTLATGLGIWSPITVQLGAFNTVGRADLNSTGRFSFAEVTAFQIQIVTNTTGSVTVGMDDIALIGGAGPDSFAGVAYDWMYTYYNAATGCESNPSLEMADVDPPNNTTHLLPRRAAVRLTLLPSPDPQVTHIRVYRRGGTLAANYRRIDQIPAGTTTYVDVQQDADISTNDTISFVNDVPVTSTLPVPVATTVSYALNPPLGGAVLSVAVADVTNLSVNQQVTLGADTDQNQEIVIVQAVGGASFTAFVQNPHAVGDPVSAEAAYGQPCNLMAIAYNTAYFAGDKNNPHYLYYSTPFEPEYVGSPNFVEVGVPSDPITAIIPYQGALYVATRDRWYPIGPATGAAPTVYPASAAHGIFAPFGWTLTEGEIWYQAIDGLRAFSGGSGNYRSQEIEFVFQGGATPIPLADPTRLNRSVMAYWNNIVFLSYVGLDGNFHRMMYQTEYKRFRNDDLPASSLLVEVDTNTLLYGDVLGLVHQDRVGAYDEGLDPSGDIVPLPIALNLQSAYSDQGSPKNQKNYNELTLDADTAGQPLALTLNFNDGQISLPIGTLNTNGRQKQNFNVLTGLGQQAYRVSLQVTGDVTKRITLYQADLRAVSLAETRQSFDTYHLKFGTDESKLCKQVYLEYSATQTVTFLVFYDANPTAFFTFTLPPATRASVWRRLPAVKFRLLRLTGTSPADFMVWPDSKFEVKPVCATEGWNVMDMMP